ncbi:hypothetical protein I7I53_06999 [Histoplasma capsulatum var. duboisii H88]|uniref:Uncharacterized protein n=1 Tax=Ajellomyces capsulatus (strain H88) TaxID=544711 RepID=A0A8A1LI30_AJEC8|nr:hypothetical protein I7I53_06999 [Histoplasma capsulatum var. duboisii H88]
MLLCVKSRSKKSFSLHLSFFFYPSSSSPLNLCTPVAPRHNKRPTTSFDPFPSLVSIRSQHTKKQ